MMPVLEIVRTTETPSLREELRVAIGQRDALNARASIARQVASRAEASKNEAATIVNRLKQDLDTAQTAVTQRYAEALSGALRAGSPLPATPALPQADSAALTAALTHLHALHKATCELETEEQAARAKADTAAAAVDAIVEDILDREGHQLAREAIDAMQLHWRLLDRLTGLVRLDEARSAPRLRELQADVVGQIDRRKLGITHNPLFIEQMNWTGHLESLSADAERTWQSYRARLRSDPDAKLDVE